MLYKDANVIDVTLSLDTSAYGAGDVLADTQIIATQTVRGPGASAKLVSMTVIDKDDQAAAVMDFYFLDQNVSLGTENDVPSISDANALSILGHVTVAAADWKDLGGCKVATIENINLMLKARSTSEALYIAATTAGTPTQTASGIVVRLGLEQQ